MLETNAATEVESAGDLAKVRKKEQQYYEPTKSQLLLAIFLFAGLLLVCWEIPRLAIFS
jgi:hypothetical protein